MKKDNEGKHETFSEEAFREEAFSEIRTRKAIALERLMDGDIKTAIDMALKARRVEVGLATEAINALEQAELAASAPLQI